MLSISKISYRIYISKKQSFFTVQSSVIDSSEGVCNPFALIPETIRYKPEILLNIHCFTKFVMYWLSYQLDLWNDEYDNKKLTNIFLMLVISVSRYVP